MKLEHCQKCKKQIEFRDKKNPNHRDDIRSQMNKIETARRSRSASVYTFWYCDDCWSLLEILLNDKKYIPTWSFEDDG